MKAICHPRRNRSILFLGFLFFETDFLLEVGILDVFKAEAILASNISKFGKLCLAIDREDLHSSDESTISNSLNVFL